VRHRRSTDYVRVVTAIAVAGSVFTLGGCGYLRPAETRGPNDADIHARSTHRLEKVPEQAAACIAEHARRGGYTPEIVPLYGLESVGVTVKTGTVGDVLAVFSVIRANAGASAAVTTMTGAVKDRGEFVKRLVQGC
jgi:hypothetical protein